MRRVAIALLFVVLASAAFIGYRIYNNYARSEECIEDVLRLIRELQDMRSEKNSDDLEHAYRFRQHVIDARRLLSPWMADPQPDRHRIAEAANGALTEFERGADLFMQLSHNAHNEQLAEEQLAEFKVKLDSGRQRLFEISAAIHKHPPPLTRANKKRLIRYIDNVFGAELEAQQKSKTDPKAQMFYEIVAVQLIRNDLEASPKPVKELF